jgi:hypothetical protein
VFTDRKSLINDIPGFSAGDREAFNHIKACEKIQQKISRLLVSYIVHFNVFWNVKIGY